MNATIRLLLLCALTLLLPTQAQAAGPLGDDGSPLTTSRYGLDLSQTAVWSGSRLTSLGGSYVAVAFDVDGMLQNPAAPAVRPDFSVEAFDYWLGLGLTLPGSLSGMDFFNSGQKTQLNAEPDSLLYITPAFIVQVGNFGFGVNVEYQRYGLGEVELTPEDPRQASNLFVQTHLQVAYAFRQGEYVVGGGIRTLNNELRARRVGALTADVPVAAEGLGAELGFLWKPRHQYFQIGLAYRSPITAKARFSDAALITTDGDIVIPTDLGDFYLPTRAELPWDVNVGVMFRFGRVEPNAPTVYDSDSVEKELSHLRYRTLLLEEERDLALGACKTEPECETLREHYELALADMEVVTQKVHREGYWKMQELLAKRSRRWAMVTASLLVTGSVEEAVGVESFLSQQVGRSGEQVVFSPRLGSEVEVIPDWLRLRSGTYLEPTRFETGSPRPHFTGGVDLPLGVWNVFGLWPDDYRWRLAGSVDIARDFSTWSVTIGGWYPRHRGKVTRPEGEPAPPALMPPSNDPWPILRPDRE